MVALLDSCFYPVTISQKERLVFGVVINLSNQLNLGWQCITIKLHHLIALKKYRDSTLFTHFFTSALEFKNVVPAIGMEVAGQQ